MSYAIDAKKMLAADEGRKSRPYKCTAGKITIGIGRNLDDNGLSEEEIDMLFNNDLRRCVVSLEKNIKCYDSLSGARQLVLINMMFNMGATRLKEFKKFFAALEAGKWGEAADEMLDSDWAKQVPARANRLAAMMRENVNQY